MYHRCIVFILHSHNYMRSMIDEVIGDFDVVCLHQQVLSRQFCTSHRGWRPAQVHDVAIHKVYHILRLQLANSKVLPPLLYRSFIQHSSFGLSPVPQSNPKIRPQEPSDVISTLSPSQVRLPSTRVCTIALFPSLIARSTFLTR